jgi:uncharacterized OB-fold protein
MPVPDERSSPYWQAAAQHVLVHARCSRCGAFSFPVDYLCSHCRTTEPDFVFEAVSGAGVVRSWTIVRQSFLPGFENDVPFLLVDVELAEQSELRMVARLLDGAEADLRIGDPVQVAFEDVADGVSVPAFTLARPVRTP